MHVWYYPTTLLLIPHYPNVVLLFAFDLSCLFLSQRQHNLDRRLISVHLAFLTYCSGIGKCHSFGYQGTFNGVRLPNK